MPGTLEEFQQGIPLNDELKRLKEGMTEVVPAAPEAPEAWNPEDTNRELRDDEREDLARLMRESGWRVLQRLRKRTLHRMEKAAIVASENNPLGRAQEIAVGWANLSAFREQARLDQAMVDAEIARLKEE